MDTKNTYYNIGQDPTIKSGIDGQEPILLLMNKVHYDGYDNTPHSHLYLEVFYFLSGKGRLVQGKNVYDVFEGDVLIVNPGVIHSLNNKSDEPLVFYSLLLDNIKIEGLKQNSISKSPILLRRKDEDTTIFDLFIKLKQEIIDKKFGWYLSIKGLCYTLFTQLTRLNQAICKPNFTENNEIYKVKEYIEENYQSDITLDKLVQVAYVNKYYLIHSFKKQFNISPMHYLNIVRIAVSKDLLTQTEMSIAEIASKVGFNNPVYFAEQFKSVIGTTPSIYRKITTE
jgi:AraC-like DNA-binding protein/mannose-6-phosphate isomerase-like protein (cupin superfamily)